MTDTLEVRNDGKSPIFVSACRTTISGNLFIHVSDLYGSNAHPGRAKRVEPDYYEIITVDEILV